ncbi:MAG: beta-ketoacyl synthase N-terminal-like domain-containing protein [Bdellovibrionota bacterium]
MKGLKRILYSFGVRFFKPNQLMMDKKTLDKNETKIAVVGLSCRYPGASNPKELWENILAGRRQFRDFPKKRLPVDQYTSKSNLSEGQKRFPQGAFIDGWSFDHLAWRIPKSTWESTDPVHWLALELATAAIEIAGGAQKFSNRSTAVYVGNTLTGEVTRSRSMRLRWPFVKRTLKQVFNDEEMPAAEQDKYLQAFEARFNAPFPEVNEDTLAGSLSNTIAGRICNYFDFKGGGYTVDGACASSLLAIITACERLSAGTIDCALAGGVDISLDPFELIGFAKAGALAKDQLYIYDRRANGMMPGEGGGFVVLKRLEDAIKDQDTIYAELNGWGISSDGKGSITAPQSQGQSRALLTAWKKAGYEHSKIDFIEGHGTGTALGDPVELKGMNVALEQIAGSSESLCGVTSLKSIIGHTKAAAGIGALIKAILGVNQRVLPPTANCEYPHDVFHEKSNRLFPIRTAKQLNPNQCVYAGVSAMGFGGINAHVALSSSSVPHAVFMPSVPISLLSATYQRAEVFVVSGASENECMGSLDQLFEDCQGISLAEMTDLSRKTWSSEHGLFRAAIVARTSEELGEKINALKNSIVSYGFKEKHAPQDCFLGNHIKPAPIGIVFPGQGSQFIGAARTRFRRSQISDAIKEMALAVATPKVKEILLRAFDPEDSLLNEDEISAAIAKTDVAQIAITAASLAWWEWLSRVGLKATKISGHSLGEISALYAAGGIDLKQALTIASIRGEAMAKSLQGGMVSLFLNKSDTQKFLSEHSFSNDPRDVSKFAVVANFNSPRQTIISASEEALARVLRLLIIIK